MTGKPFGGLGRNSLWTKTGVLKEGKTKNILEGIRGMGMESGKKRKMSFSIPLFRICSVQSVVRIDS